MVYINPQGEACLNLAKVGVNEPEFGYYDQRQVCGANQQIGGSRKRRGAGDDNVAPPEVPATPAPIEIPEPIEEPGLPSDLWFDAAGGEGSR